MNWKEACHLNKVFPDKFRIAIEYVSDGSGEFSWDLAYRHDYESRFVRMFVGTAKKNSVIKLERYPENLKIYDQT